MKRWACVFLMLCAGSVAQEHPPDLPLTRMLSLPVQGDDRVLNAIVSVTRLDAEGHVVDRCSGFISAPNIITTALECVAGGKRVELLFRSGRKVQVDTVVRYDRNRRWAQLTASTVERPIPAGDPAKVEAEDTLQVFSVEGKQGLTPQPVSARRLKEIALGECFEIEPRVSPASVGGPLLNAEGEAVGVLITTGVRQSVNFDLSPWVRLAVMVDERAASVVPPPQ